MQLGSAERPGFFVCQNFPAKTAVTRVLTTEEERMSTAAASFHLSRKSWLVVSALCLTIALAIALPDLHRTAPRPVETRQLLVATNLESLSASMAGKEPSDMGATGGHGVPDSARMLRRDTSVELLVKNPAETS